MLVVMAFLGHLQVLAETELGASWTGNLEEAPHCQNDEYVVDQAGLDGEGALVELQSQHFLNL